MVVSGNDPASSIFGSGRAATLPLRCSGPLLSQACLVGAVATRNDQAPVAVCSGDCVPLECGSCMAGDCDGSGVGDAEDGACMLQCLLDQNGADVDCSCAADCNCIEGTEISDAVCALRRGQGSFGPDPCTVPPGEIAGPDAQVAVLLDPPRLLANGVTRRVILRLDGADSANVAAIHAQLSSGSEIRRIRLRRRLRKAGFTLRMGRSDEHHVAFAVLAPDSGHGIPAIEAGPVVHVTWRGEGLGIVLGAVRYASTGGLPLHAAP